MTRRHEQVLASLADCVSARAEAIDADDQLDSLTLVVRLSPEGEVKMVLYRTESRVTGVRSGIRMARPKAEG